jgi:hypothetical protein
MRTGNCHEDAFNKITGFGDKYEWTLVHGMPLGAGGAAKDVGRYPHSWLERDHVAGHTVVWDPNTGGEYPAGFYYAAGNIVVDDCIRYTKREAMEASMEHETSGPWAEIFLDRDAEIDELLDL